MPAAPRPADETQRLATLRSYHILDTPRDPAFDRLAHLAAEHYDAPIAAVTLIDADRLWFKALIGLGASEAPRDYAFCAHAIMKPDDLFVVEDMRDDARFSDNPFVLTDPNIRFYAGAPLRAENGQPLGSLCILDRAPRKLDAKGRQFLAALGAATGSMLELHRKNLALDALATTDPLTGLANRRRFEAALDAAFEATPAGSHFGMLCIDLDNFKTVNDTHGHDAGDALLREVAIRLQDGVRNTDLVARTGGDEFVVLLREATDVNELHGVASRIMASFGLPHQIGDGQVPIEASIGAALAPVHGASATALKRAADQALYTVKRAGRGRVLVAGHGAPDCQINAAALLERDLCNAIHSGGLELHWQPYFAIGSEIPTGFEALARWNRPSYGPVPPSIFIPIAERSGLIGLLDAFVVHAACRAAAAWAGSAAISVNLSPHWFKKKDDLLTLIGSALCGSGLPPHRLVLELTERTLVQDPDAARACIAALKSRGVRVALDDFGVGYSSLGYLSQFEFDTVKLDRSFVSGLGVDRRVEAVVHAVLALSRALDMKVCAEGVETVEQLQFLTDVGCDFVQGYYLGRPQPLPIERKLNGAA